MKVTEDSIEDISGCRLHDSEQKLLWDLMWDGMGNLAQVNGYEVDGQSATHSGSRLLYWTEDSRLANAVDDRYFSHYAYCEEVQWTSEPMPEKFLTFRKGIGKGERALKLTGNNSVFINSDAMLCSATRERSDDILLIMLSRDAKAPTMKHYYAGAERICAKVGNSGLNHFGGFIITDTAMAGKSQRLLKACAASMPTRVVAQNNAKSLSQPCDINDKILALKLKSVPSQVDADVSAYSDYFLSIMAAVASPPPSTDEDVFHFHGDHLGSASWITDRTGQPVQHLQYLPFGEPFVNQRAAGSPYKERFTFTGKEPLSNAKKISWDNDKE